MNDYVSNLMFYIPIAIWLFSTFFFYYKYDKEYKVSFTGRYFKEKASHDPVAMVTCLTDFKSLGLKDIYATIIELMQNGYLSFDGEFHIINEDYSNLYPHQISLMEKLSSPKDEDTDFVTGWAFLASQDSKNFEYYEPQSFVRKVGLLGSIFYTAIGVFGIIMSHKFRFFLLFVISVITFFHMRKITKRTRTAQGEYERWMALKRFLSDYDGKEEIDKALLPFAYSLGVLPGENDSLEKLCEEYKGALDKADFIIH